MNKVSNFIKEVTARLQGDNAGVIAAYNERKANSAFESQIQSINSKIVDAEDNLSDAEEALKVAQYPTEKIAANGNTQYLSNIKAKYEALEEAKAALKDLNDSLKFWKGMKKGLFSETEDISAE